MIAARPQHTLLIFVAAALALDAAGDNPPKPFLGVRMTPHDQPIEVDDQTFTGGIHIDSVIQGTAAAKAGLQAGDIIIAVDGIDFDTQPADMLNRFRARIQTGRIGGQLTLTILRDEVCQSAGQGGKDIFDDAVWDDPQAFAATQDPGIPLILRFERIRELRTIEVTLGPRPLDDLGLKSFPPNRELLPDGPTPDPDEHLLQTLLETPEESSNYADLRKRLTRLVHQGDAFRRSIFTCAMREPFTLSALAQRLGDVPDAPANVVAHAARWLDVPRAAIADADQTPPLQTGLTPAQHADQLADLLAEAHARFERAFAALSDDERQFLRDQRDDLSRMFIESLMILDHPDTEGVQRVIRWTELASRVNLPALCQAGSLIARTCDPAYLAALRDDLADHTGPWPRRDTPWGPIVFAGTADDWHQNAAAILIDVAGDDFYTNPAPDPCSIILDLAGNDQYQATVDAAIAGAWMGLAVIADLQGNDAYIGQRWSLGAAALGLGLLVDHAGNDNYNARDYSQACALVGLGLLLDNAGEDHYHAPRYAQALGLPGGFALLRDRAGDDQYYCTGRDLTAYATPGVFDGFGQGCAIGFRHLASGGLALLLDDAGDDQYQGGNFSQGGGYYFAWGNLIDHAGNDRYHGSRYNQAFAAHQAIGYLQDHSGDDRYIVRRDVGQSCAWDESLTMLEDHAGDDWYSGGGFALCAAAHNGIALFKDAAGKDTYASTNGLARAFPNDYHGGTSLALAIDRGGQTDRYPDRDRNNTRSRRQSHGFHIDFPQPRDTDQTPPLPPWFPQ